MKAKELEQLLHKEIPISQAMGIEVEHLEKNTISIKAPFEKNKNIHNTAFAGSIYTTATLAGWSLLTNLLRENNLTGSVVLAKAEIRYLRPINSDIVANATLNNLTEIERLVSDQSSHPRLKIEQRIDLVEQNIIKAKMIAKFAIV